MQIICQPLLGKKNSLEKIFLNTHHLHKTTTLYLGLSCEVFEFKKSPHRNLIKMFDFV